MPNPSFMGYFLVHSGIMLVSFLAICLMADLVKIDNPWDDRGFMRAWKIYSFAAGIPALGIASGLGW